jgi:hypothetical protein
MLRSIIASLILAVFPGCTAAPESSPLAILGRLDSAEVTVQATAGRIPMHSTLVRDSATLADLRAIASKPGDWHPNGVGTTPAGDMRVALYRGTVYVGVVSAGDNWIGARDAAGNERFRRMTAADSLRVAKIRAVK